MEKSQNEDIKKQENHKHTHVEYQKDKGSLDVGEEEDVLGHEVPDWIKKKVDGENEKKVEEF